MRTVSDLERGVSHTPHTDTVALLAEAQGLQGPDRGAFVVAAGRLRAPASLAQPGRGMASVASDSDVSPFVGRQRELALLERHLAGQGPPVLLLAGEPGIGKTRLLHVATPRAIGHGLAVLEGGCQRRGAAHARAPRRGNGDA
jgi:ATP-dependent Clp protease ATP-binding subunit ClpA